jgi:hypothetical protein
VREIGWRKIEWGRIFHFFPFKSVKHKWTRFSWFALFQQWASSGGSAFCLPFDRNLVDIHPEELNMEAKWKVLLAVLMVIGVVPCFVSQEVWTPKGKGQVANREIEWKY